MLFFYYLCRVLPLLPPLFDRFAYCNGQKVGGGNCKCNIVILKMYLKLQKAYFLIGSRAMPYGDSFGIPHLYSIVRHSVLIIRRVVPSGLAST